MRRSHSSSNIPLPRNQMGQREGVALKPSTRRSRSTNRLSHQDSTSSLKRNPSVDRKSTATRPSKTPLAYATRSSKTPVASRSKACSIVRGTSLFGSGQRGACLGPSPRSLQEKKTIQKLSTDKKWVSEQFAKVQEFVALCPCLDQTVANPNNLKPPSIKAFIHLTEVLLQQFFPNLHLETSNYKEVIGEKLKVMRYPGTLANSILKTVNTMHSWPQVIGMLSWLVDKVNLALGSPDVSLLCLDIEEKQTYKKMQACRDLFFKRYTIFNDSAANPDQLSQVNNSYINTLSEILNVDPVAYSNLEAEVAEKKSYKDNQDREIQHLMTVNRETKEQIDKINEEIDESKVRETVMHLELEDTIHTLTSRKSKLVEERSVMKNEIKSLQETVKMQPCTYQCKKELLSKIDELKREIEAKKEKTRFKQNIKRDFDDKLDMEMLTIHEMVIDWNRRLVPLGIKEHRLKALELRETGFHRPEFLEEIKQLQNKQAVMKADISRELERVEIEMEGLLEQQNKLNLEKIALESRANKIKEESQVVVETSTALKAETLEIVQRGEQEQLQHLIEQEELQSSSDLKAISEQVCQLQMECQVSAQDLEKYSEKIVAFFLEVNKQVKDTIIKMHEIMDKFEDKLERGVLKTQKNYTNLLKKFEELEQLKLMLEKKEL